MPAARILRQIAISQRSCVPATRGEPNQPTGWLEIPSTYKQDQKAVLDRLDQKYSAFVFLLLCHPVLPFCRFPPSGAAIEGQALHCPGSVAETGPRFLPAFPMTGYGTHPLA